MTARRRVAIIFVAVGAAVGGAIAWFVRQLLHLHDPGLSNHARH